mgnify:CR=1 FL=1
MVREFTRLCRQLNLFGGQLLAIDGTKLNERFRSSETVERVRECGVEIVSSADLLQYFVTWDEKDREAHRAYPRPRSRRARASSPSRETPHPSRCAPGARDWT